MHYKEFFTTLYNNFNRREIDAVIQHMDENVKWANGMDGGFVYGHEGVRKYWTRQFTMVSPQVQPIDITEQNNKVVAKVHQVVHDIEGNLLADDVITHEFMMMNNKVLEFTIGNKEASSVTSVNTNNEK